MGTNFNFKSSVCTSREQSERLLALGLKKKTADMCLSKVDVFCQTFDLMSPHSWTKEQSVSDTWYPAWSLHRLLCLLPKHIQVYDNVWKFKRNLYLSIDEDCMPEDGVNVFDLLSNSNKYKDSKNIDAPTLYEAQKWLREEKKLIVLVGFDFCPITSEIVYNWVIVVNGNTAKKSSYTYDYFEEALSEGIKESVKILKENETIHE